VNGAALQMPTARRAKQNGKTIVHSIRAVVAGPGLYRLPENRVNAARKRTAATIR
jgi:hypothetical protein